MAWAKMAHYEDLMLALQPYNADTDIEGPLGIQIRRYLEKKIGFDADAIAQEEMQQGLMEAYEPKLI